MIGTINSAYEILALRETPFTCKQINLFRPFAFTKYYAEKKASCTYPKGVKSNWNSQPLENELDVRRRMNLSALAA